MGFNDILPVGEMNGLNQVIQPLLVHHNSYCSEVKWTENRSVLSGFLQPHGLYSSWNSPGQSTRVGSLSLLQGIFPTQGSNAGLPHCRQILYQLSHKRSPSNMLGMFKISILIQVKFNKDHLQEKEMQKSKMAVWGDLTNSCKKKKSKKQRRKRKSPIWMQSFKE